MSLKKYFKKRKIVFLKCKIELSTDIELKTLFYQRMSNNHLKKQLKRGKKRFIINIIGQKYFQSKQFFVSGF